jgi:hypothetical protein
MSNQCQNSKVNCRSTCPLCHSRPGAGIQYPACLPAGRLKCLAGDCTNRIKMIRLRSANDTNMSKNKSIKVEGVEIVTFTKKNNDYISLTDIARYKNPEFPADIVKNWMRTRSTIDFLGLWEKLNNQNFKLVEFDQFKSEFRKFDISFR